MSRTPKEKLETYTDASLQILPRNIIEGKVVIAADDDIQVNLKNKKEEANKPLFLKRI